MFVVTGQIVRGNQESHDSLTWYLGNYELHAVAMSGVRVEQYTSIIKSCRNVRISACPV